MLEAVCGPNRETIDGPLPGDFGGVTRKVKNTLINDHFSQNNYLGIQDILINILNFIATAPGSEAAKQLRLEIESAWIGRLKTAFPDGLNYLE